MALTETRKLRYIQRQGRYHYFRHPLLKLARGKGRLPGKEGSPQYLTEYYRLLARAEHGAPRAEGERPDRVTFRTGSVGWVALAFAGDSEFGLPTRKPRHETRLLEDD